MLVMQVGERGHFASMPTEFIPYGFGGASQGTHINTLHFEIMAADHQQQHAKWLRTIKMNVRR